MRYRTFPKIPGLDVSILGFGCMRLPVVDGDAARIDEERATALVRDAIDGGVNYLDTAYPYHGGESEPFLGRALRGGYRARVQLATKCPTWMVRSERDWERFLDEQLARLQSPTVDFYLLHGLGGERWETVKRLGGLRALDRARADRRIAHAGFSFHGSPDAFAAILAGYDWEFCQIQLNFVDVDYQAGLAGLRLAASRGVGVIAMEPLRGGVLAAPPPEPVRRIWAGGGRPWPPAEWAWRWVWHHPEVVTALSGMNADAQLRENLAIADDAAAGALGAGDLATVAAVRDHFLERTQVRCTTCGYCQPCPNGVAIPDVFSMVNTTAMFDSRRATSALYRALLVSRGVAADACLECGECVPKCPQGIPIPDALRDAHELLGGGA
ncbi:MAG TPA: aldo/keto reductase [Thermoanaerobaculaceae bacterium]|nr:aldo/keto reductase [Thermoanaerobaculaceae bacterium]